MKTEIIFWLDSKTGRIYHKLYSNAYFRKVGEENQFGHTIIAICIIKDRKLYCVNDGVKLYERKEKKKTIRQKTIDYAINKLIKLRGKE